MGDPHFDHQPAEDVQEQQIHHPHSPESTPFVSCGAEAPSVVSDFSSTWKQTFPSWFNVIVCLFQPTDTTSLSFRRWQVGSPNQLHKHAPLAFFKLPGELTTWLQCCFTTGSWSWKLSTISHKHPWQGLLHDILKFFLGLLSGQACMHQCSPVNGNVWNECYQWALVLGDEDGGKLLMKDHKPTKAKPPYGAQCVQGAIDELDLNNIANVWHVSCLIQLLCFC